MRITNVNVVRDVAYLLPMHMIGDIVGIAEADLRRRTPPLPRRAVHAGSSPCSSDNSSPASTTSTSPGQPYAVAAAEQTVAVSRDDLPVRLDERRA
jgi:hypothetical protein